MLATCESAISGFANDGFDINRYTPYAGLARMQVSEIDENKQRNVFDEVLHNLLLQGRCAWLV